MKVPDIGNLYLIAPEDCAWSTARSEKPIITPKGCRSIIGSFVICIGCLRISKVCPDRKARRLTEGELFGLMLKDGFDIVEQIRREIVRRREIELLPLKNK